MAVQGIATTPLVTTTNAGNAAQAFLGAGLAPAGSCAAGFGTPASAATSGPNSYGTGAYLDPVRRDYSFDASGNRLKTGTVVQLVQLALGTVYNSSVLDGLGLKPFGPVLTPAAVAAITDNHVKACAHIVAQGLMRIVSIAVGSTFPGQVQVVLVWLDLTTGREQTTTLAPRT